MATPTQIKRRGRLSLILGILVAAVAFAAVAYADAVTDVSVTVKGTEATDTYTKTTSVKVAVSANHCPPGGDMNAIEVSLRNSALDAWTVVKAGGIDWPSGNCVGAVPPATAAEFDWTLAAGSDGSRTVFVQLRHGGDVALAQDSITLDTTPPVITDGGPTPSTPNGAGGWYISAVSNAFSASDTGGSGLDGACAAAFPKSVSTGSSEGSSVTVSSGACSDVAGNTNAGISSTAFKIDLSDPNVAITSPGDGSTTSDSSITVSGTASDAISGIARVNLTVNASALATDATLGTGTAEGTWSQSGVALQCGSNTIKATATDAAGRTKDSTQIGVTRTCVTYTFTGFYGGVDPENVAKAGQSISLRWNLYNGAIALANEITSTAGYELSSTKISCALVGTGDAVPTADDAGASGLRYDTFATPTANANGQYVFVWKTLKDWANTCRRFDVKYGSVTLSAEFRFTR